MANSVRIQLLARAARSASSIPSEGEPAALRSILSAAATSYGSRPGEDMTTPTGFDPVAAILFEAIIEGAYLVAHADDTFDEEERRAFERVVLEACGGTVSLQQVNTLVAGLHRRLESEGIDARIARLAAGVSKKAHAREILRVAALIAQTSEGISAVERDVLGKLAAQCDLQPSEVDDAVAMAKAALESSPGV